MHPVCVRCERILKPKRCGTFVIEKAEGVDDDGQPTFYPYRVWAGDVYACPSCGYEVVVNFGRGPASEHYMENFREWLSHAKVQAR